MFNFGCKKNSEKKQIIDVNKPVTNPKLVNTMNIFVNNRTEENAIKLGEALNESNFLIIILTDEMEADKNSNGNVTIKKGSTIKFLNCYNESNECFLPLFTDWDEVRKWTTEKVDAFVMPADEVWDFVLSDDSYKGSVINPGSIGWTLNLENINNLKSEIQK